MLGDNIKKIRKEKGISLNDMVRVTGISIGYLSDIENNKNTNPTLDKIDKIADALEIPKSELLNDNLDIENLDNISTTKEIFNYKFKTAEAATEYILKQPVVADFGGYDIDNLSDKEINQFAKELLSQLQLVGFKYKK